MRGISRNLAIDATNKVWQRVWKGVPVSWEERSNEYPYVNVRFGVVKTLWMGKDPRLVIVAEDGQHYLRDLDSLRIYSNVADRYISAKNLFRSI